VQATDKTNSPQILVLLGAPRSGTTFVQRELSQYPGVVTTTELHYFPQFASPQLRRFEQQIQSIEDLGNGFDASGQMKDRVISLAAVIERSEFLSFLRSPIDQLCERATREYEDTTVFMMKNPTDAIFSLDASSILPDAHWLNVIRSPHDVVKSYRSISKDWGGKWAPRSVVIGCFLWRMCVLGALQLEDLPNFTTVIYEETRKNPGEVLSNALREIGLSELAASEGRVEAKWLTSSLGERLHDESGPIEPKTFGDGTVARPRLSGLQTRIVTMLCRDLMGRFGYLDEGERTSLNPVVGKFLQTVEYLYNTKAHRDVKRSFSAKATDIALI
jgi:hypothetical protein